MSARVEVGDNLALKVEGGKELFYAGSVLTDDLDHVLLGSVEGGSLASVASLRAALPKLFKRYFHGRNVPWSRDKWKKERYWIGLVQSEDDLWRLQVQEEGSWSWGNRKIPPTSPAIILERDGIGVRVTITTDRKPDLADARRLLQPFITRHQASFELETEPVSEGPGFVVTLDMQQAWHRGQTLGELWKLGDDARALLQAADGGELPRSAVLDLLSAGRWDLFKGQPETEWLEVKGDPYDHLEETLGKNWRYELAKDVAAFANAPEGGMIVLGMTTKDRGDGDVIEGHKEFDLVRVKAPAYRRLIARDVYPRVEGFEVCRIPGETSGYGLAVLVIPPQPASSQPFLVQGAISNQKVLGAHVLLPQRREDEVASLDAGAIHARLRLGDQVIAGELEPKSSGV